MQCQEPEHFRIWPRPKKTRVFPQISAGSHSQGTLPTARAISDLFVL